MLLRALEERGADQHRDTTAVLAHIFLFIRGTRPGSAHFRRHPFVEREVFRRRYIGPAYLSGPQIVAAIPNHAQQGIVRFADAPVQIPEKDADDIGFDQVPETRFPVLHVSVELGVFQRNRGLTCQQFQYDDPTGGEGVRDEIIFQVEQADWHGLPQEGQAQHRLWPAPDKVRIAGKRMHHGRIRQQDRLCAAPDIVQHGFR